MDYSYSHSNFMETIAFLILCLGNSAAVFLSCIGAGYLISSIFSIAFWLASLIYIVIYIILTITCVMLFIKYSTIEL